MPNKRIVFYSYVKNSGTLSLLSEFFDDSFIVKHNNKSFLPKDDDVIIFWGTHRYPAWYERAKNNRNILIINSPESIAIACNKLLSFNKFYEKDILIPEYTTNIETANNFIKPVLARETLGGQGGVGIEIISDGMGIPVAKIYVKYIDKDKEYRVHVFNNKAIKYSRKIPRSSVECHDEFIWSHDNGYYFNRVRPNSRAEEISLRAINAIGLDFGAVDIVVKDGLYYVLEVNTAPGLQGQSVEVYGNAIKNFIEEKEREHELI